MSFDLFNSNLLTLIIAAGPVTKSVLVILLLLSVTCWAIIFYKWQMLRRTEADNRRFKMFFRKIGDLSELKMRAEYLGYSSLARVFLEVYAYVQPHLDSENGREISMRSVQGWLRTSVEVQVIRFEEYLTILATTGNVSPFIGLFGTVLGIMDSFQAIGRLGTASIAAVAPGVAEALLATAAGLFAAIPAVVAYNYFVNRIRSLVGEMEIFSGELINRIEERVAKIKATI